LGLSCKVGHIDTSSFHVDGVYNSDQEDVPEGVIHITQGYSRDHRPDLNQVILQLISDLIGPRRKSRRRNIRPPFCGKMDAALRKTDFAMVPIIAR
jgi:hypothetical protein